MMTVFAKPFIMTQEKWNLIYSLTLMLYSSTVYTLQTYGYRWLSLVSQMAFCWFCLTKMVYYRACEPMNSINKNICGAKLLPTTISAYPMDCVCFCHLLKTQHCCLCSNARYDLPPAGHSPPPPSSPPPISLPLTHATPDITLQLLWKVAQNPALLYII